jgi:hypothetical protein
MKLLVEPIYGWGWTDLHGQSVEVPEQFVLDASVLKEGQPFYAAAGRLENNGQHPFHGLWILLSQRHTIHDGAYNISASDVEHGHNEPLPESTTVAFMGYAMARQI